MTTAAKRFLSELFMVAADFQALEHDEPPRNELGPLPNIGDCEKLGVISPAATLFQVSPLYDSLLVGRGFRDSYPWCQVGRRR
jgi:hypothetical protein